MGHNVFIDRMLNKNAFLVLDGNDACDFPSMRQSAINDEIEKVKKDVKYLDDWRQDVVDEQKANSKCLP